MIGRRSYSGSSIDASYQHISERPALDEEAEDVVYATEPEDAGEERTENVPVPDSEPEEIERPDADGQTTLSDWGGSA